MFSHDGKRYNWSKWSPDGRWLAAERAESTSVGLFASNGRLVNTLSLGCYMATGSEDFSWLSDGRISCFTGNHPPILRIAELDQEGQFKRSTEMNFPMLLDTFIYALQWNPHHLWLATIADKKPGETSPTLYLTDQEGHNLISPLRIDSEQLAWSPDGITLALVLRRGDVLLLKVQESEPGKLTVTKSRQLAAGTDDLQNVEWSPSGHWLVCRHVSYESEDYLFLLAADGSGKQVKLTSSTTDGQLAFPAWSPDGKQLIVSRVSDSALFSIDMVKLLKEKGVEP
jgi:Tol biopolymer transport system component